MKKFLLLITALLTIGVSGAWAQTITVATNSGSWNANGTWVDQTNDNWGTSWRSNNGYLEIRSANTGYIYKGGTPNYMATTTYYLYGLNGKKITGYSVSFYKKGQNAADAVFTAADGVTTASTSSTTNASVGTLTVTGLSGNTTITVAGDWSYITEFTVTVEDDPSYTDVTGKSFTLQCSRGYVYYNGSVLKGTATAGEASEFAIVNYNSESYLYDATQKAFVIHSTAAKAGSTGNASLESNSDFSKAVKGLVWSQTGISSYPYFLEDKYTNWLNMDGNKNVFFNTWKDFEGGSGGNTYKIEIVDDDFDDAEAILLLKKYDFLTQYQFDESNLDKPGFPTTAGKSAFVSAINAITTSDNFDTKSAAALTAYKASVKYPEVGKVYKLKENAGLVLYAYSKKNDTTKPTMSNAGTTTNNSYFRVTAIGTPSDNVATITLVDLYGNPLRYSTATGEASYSEATAGTTSTVTSIKTEFFSATYGTTGQFYLGGAAHTTDRNKVDGASSTYNTLTNPYFLGTWTTETYGGCRWTFEEVDVSSLTAYTIVLSGAPEEISLADGTKLNNGTATVYLSSAPTFPEIENYWNSVSNVGNTYTVTYSDDYTPFVTTNIMPFINNPGNGYFELPSTYASMFNSTIESYSTDGISFEEYTALYTGLQDYINYPKSGYYRLKNKSGGTYMGVNGSTFVGNISSTSNLSTIISVERSGKYGLILSTQGLYGQAAAGGYDATLNAVAPETAFNFEPYRTPGYITIHTKLSGANAESSYYSLYGGKISSWNVEGNTELWEFEDVSTVDIPLPAKAGGYSYGTMYLPFGVTMEGSAATAYYTTVDGNVATAFAIDEVPAGTGVILRASGSVDNVTVTIKSTAAAVTTGNKLTGTYLDKTDERVTGEYILGVYEGKIGFYQRGSGRKIGANKAYLQLEADVSAGVKGIMFNFDDTDGIDAAQVENEQRTKDAVIYNLAGQRLSQPQKGINIINGKKVIVK